MAYSVVDISEAMVEISKLSTGELKDLCNCSSDERYDQLVEQSQRVKSLKAEREMLMASVRSLAEFNLARQSDYESDRSKLLVLVGDSNKLKEEIQEKATKLLDLSKKTSLESTLAVLLAAVAQAEEESESKARELLDNSLDYDTFINQYIEKRKLLHLRRIKADRLRQETNESWTAHCWYFVRHANKISYYSSYMYICKSPGEFKVGELLDNAVHVYDKYLLASESEKESIATFKEDPEQTHEVTRDEYVIVPLFHSFINPASYL